MHPALGVSRSPPGVSRPPWSRPPGRVPTPPGSCFLTPPWTVPDGPGRLRAALDGPARPSTAQDCIGRPWKAPDGPGRPQTILDGPRRHWTAPHGPRPRSSDLSRTSPNLQRRWQCPDHFGRLDLCLSVRLRVRSISSAAPVSPTQTGAELRPGLSLTQTGAESDSDRG
eukprot:gene15830-biopygen3711